MEKRILFKLTLLLSFCCMLIQIPALGQEYKEGVQQGVVRVKFTPQLSAKMESFHLSNTSTIQTGIQVLDAANQQLQAVAMKRVFPYAPRLDKKHKKYGLDLWFDIYYKSSTSTLEATAIYANLSAIEIAEQVLEKRIISSAEKEVGKVTTVEENLFNDPLLVDQWHFTNTGALEGAVIGSDVNLEEAWQIQTGAPNVVVCVVDGGIDTDHADLKANLWQNIAELEGETGIDDDGNGYIDDYYGYNFVNNSGQILPHPHGTHVAGTIAAVNNNRIGVAGIAGGSGNGDGVKLMSAQIFNENSSSTDMAAAIVYGADNGAVISQNSWGYVNPGYYEQSVLDAIDYFIAEAGQYEGSPMKGGIVFFAAGNDNADGLYYPGVYENTISVAAMSRF